jgi:hypothetical protein
MTFMAARECGDGESRRRRLGDAPSRRAGRMVVEADRMRLTTLTTK